MPTEDIYIYFIVYSQLTLDLHLQRKSLVCKLTVPPTWMSCCGRFRGVTQDLTCFWWEEVAILQLPGNRVVRRGGVRVFTVDSGRSCRLQINTGTVQKLPYSVRNQKSFCIPLSFLLYNFKYLQVLEPKTHFIDQTNHQLLSDFDSDWCVLICDTTVFKENTEISQAKDSNSCRTCWDAELPVIDEPMGSGSLCPWGSAGEKTLSDSCGVWMDWRGLFHSLQSVLILSSITQIQVRSHTQTHTHLLCVLPLCLASLLHLARLFENQTFKREIQRERERVNHVKSRKNKCVILCECPGEDKWWVYLDGVLWQLDLRWQFLSGVHVRVLAVREFWSGETEPRIQVNKKKEKMQQTHTSFYFFFFWFWVYLARVPYSAPGWRWFGSGAGRVRASGRGCKLSPASFCRSLLLESVDGNLHNTHTCITLACCYAYFTRIYYCIVHLCRKSSGFIV